MTAARAAEVTQNVANASAGATTSLGVLTFLNTNADALGLLISVITGIAAVIFYIVSYRLKSKSERRKWLGQLKEKAEKDKVFDIRELKDDV